MIVRFDSVFKQSILALFVKGTGAIAAFVMNLVVARLLGAEESGYFFLGFTIMQFLGTLACCGFDVVILRETATAKSSVDWHSVRVLFYKSAAVCLVVSSFIAIFVGMGSSLLAGSLLNKPDFQPVLAAISPAIITFTLLWLLAHSLQGIGYVSAAVLAMNVGANVVLILIVWFLELKIGSSVAWAYSVGSLVVLCSFIFFWLQKTSPIGLPGSYGVSIRAMILSAWPLWIVLLMGQLIQWAGQFVGGAYLPPEKIAQFAVAQRTAMLVSFVLMGVNMVVAPRFASLYAAGDVEGVRQLAIGATRLMLIGATPIVVIMIGFPRFLMSLFGEGFTDGSLLLQILALGQFVNVLAGSVGYLLSMSGHERDLRNTLLIVAPLSVAVTFILVPLYGALGAALSTALAVGAQNLLAVYWVKRRLGFNTLTLWRSKSV